MRFLESLDRPSQGEILHREQDITKLKGEALRRSRQNIQIMAFATGSSWGTFAICMPLALPLAFAFTGNELTILVVAVFATVAGAVYSGITALLCPIPPFSPLRVLPATIWTMSRLSCPMRWCAAQSRWQDTCWLDLRFENVFRFQHNISIGQANRQYLLA